MTLREASDKLNQNPLIQKLYDIFNISRSDGTNDNSVLKCMELTGGAVIDILMDRTPKDFDFLMIHESILSRLSDLGFHFISDTSTAMTFSHDKISQRIQFIKTPVDEFDYTISCSLFNIGHKRLIAFDHISFNSKILVPRNWKSKKSMISALKRYPHYINKGFTLPEVTYQSLLNKALNHQEYKINS